MEVPSSDGDTGGVSVMGTSMLKSVTPQSKQAAEVSDEIRAVTGYASDVRRQIECCDRAPPLVMTSWSDQITPSTEFFYGDLFFLWLSDLRLRVTNDTANGFFSDDLLFLWLSDLRLLATNDTTNGFISGDLPFLWPRISRWCQWVLLRPNIGDPLRHLRQFLASIAGPVSSTKNWG
ncbi:hypothetical protein TIFTF001_016542 [Ficus carica]|uniref:Uncharacterized protein n=1 Tax=Ficus carica TaxID=3494 RepID=A0AA88D8V3_FICCA|nr:hypothetical protein TIFTF001_016542 [Ficus carica]